jgi:hypothetical protein
MFLSTRIIFNSLVIDYFFFFFFFVYVSGNSFLLIDFAILDLGYCLLVR